MHRVESFRIVPEDNIVRPAGGNLYFSPLDQKCIKFPSDVLSDIEKDRFQAMVMKYGNQGVKELKSWHWKQKNIPKICLQINESRPAEYLKDLISVIFALFQIAISPIIIIFDRITKNR